MKFIKLEILNLASLDRQDGEVINFEDGALGNSNIFSIVGPTGSGKSTILDAICLALYKITPRYTRKKGDRGHSIEIFGPKDDEEKNRLVPTDCRNILTRGKKNGYSKLTFLANNGITYRAECHLKFNRSKYEKPMTLLYKINYINGQYVEEKVNWEELPQIIGLDFDQFIRTVLIAQGSFAKFLTASEDERYILLEKIIGSEHLYSAIADKIKTQKDNANKVYTTIATEIDADNIYIKSEEELTELDKQIAILENERNTLINAIKKNEEYQKWYADNDKLTQTIQKLQEDYTSANQSLEEAGNDIERLKLYDSMQEGIGLLKNIKDLNTRQNNTKSEIAKLEKEVDNKKSELKDENANLEKLNNERDAIKNQIAELKPRIDEARELKTSISFKEKNYDSDLTGKTKIEKELYNAKQELKTNNELIEKEEKNKQNALKNADLTKSQIENERNNLENKHKDIESKLEIKQQLIVNQDINKMRSSHIHLSTIISELNNALSHIKSLASKRLELENNITKREAESKALAIISEQLKSLNIEKLEGEVSALTKVVNLMDCNDWRIQRDLLIEGKPCPLCGAEHHPYKADNNIYQKAFNETEHELKTKSTELKRQREEQSKLNADLATANANIKYISEAIDSLKNEIEQISNDLELIANKHSDFTDNEDQLAAKISELQETHRLLTDDIKRYDEITNEINSLQKEKDKSTKAKESFENKAKEQTDILQNNIQNINERLTQFKSQVPQLEKIHKEKEANLNDAIIVCNNSSNELSELREKLKSLLGGKDPNDVETTINSQKEEAEKKVEQKVSIINKLNNDKTNIEGKLSVKNDELNKLNNSIEIETINLNKCIEQYNADTQRVKTISVADIELMLNERDWITLRQNIQVLTKDKVPSETRLNDAIKAHQEHGKSQPAESLDELIELYHELKEKEKDDTELTSAKITRGRHNDAIKRIGTKIEELKSAKENKNDWDNIYNAIGNDGKLLRKIAQCYTLGFLVEHANNEIRKFNNRFELRQVKNSLGIRIIDHDRADDIREITSLSGGETFIVSLGLALGLSALSSRNISFENLFIDEGFGTLDPDTLAIVIDSLAMLQSSQNKKVGVISHTDTMSERITTQIRVIKNGNTGSSHIEIHP